jgi:hypothetical protein
MSERTTLGERWGAVLGRVVPVTGVPAPADWDAVSSRPMVTFPAEDVEDEVADESLGRWTAVRAVTPALDEGQIVGDLLAWLYEHNFLNVPRSELTPLQVRYFLERDA